MPFVSALFASRAWCPVPLAGVSLASCWCLAGVRPRQELGRGAALICHRCQARVFLALKHDRACGRGLVSRCDARAFLAPSVSLSPAVTRRSESFVWARVDRVFGSDFAIAGFAFPVCRRRVGVVSWQAFCCSASRLVSAT